MEATNMKRREFVGTLAATAAMLEPTALELARRNEQEEGARMKLGLYSITFLGIWYQGRGLTLEELIQRAKQYGYEGVEFDGKRPHANPLDMPTRSPSLIASSLAVSKASPSSTVSFSSSTSTSYIPGTWLSTMFLSPCMVCPCSGSTPTIFMEGFFSFK